MPATGHNSNSHSGPQGTCDATEYCNGSSIACPNDAFLNTDVVCKTSRGMCENNVYLYPRRVNVFEFG